MKLKELIMKVDFNKSMKFMIKFYYNDKSVEELEKITLSYFKVFQELKDLIPIDRPNWRIYVQYIQPGIDYTGFESEGYFDIVGKNGTLQKESEDFAYFSATTNEEFANSEISYAIEFTPWNEILGMDVAEETLKLYPIEEITAHILYEITFISFDQNEIKKEVDELNRRIESVKNGTAELISLEDLRKKLKDRTKK